MIELEHSPLGGSSATRFINCTGSFLLQKEEIEDGTFEDIPTEFAQIGTAAHLLGSTCLTKDTEPFEYLGETFEGYLAGWPGGIQLDAVTVYVNECRTILDSVASRPHDLFIERTITMPALHPLLKGTVDFGIISPQGVWLRDYKNGEGVGVSAVNNNQLLYYAFLLISSYPELEPELPVNLGIVQPNFYGLYEAPDVWITTVGEVWAWGHKVLLPRMKYLTDVAGVPDLDDFVLGEHCQFCPVTLSCPKMQVAFQRYAAGEEDFIEMLTNEELSDLYALRAAASRFMKALERTVYARKVTGGNVESAKLVEKKVARVWKPGAELAIKARFGEKGFSAPAVLSPAAIEKLSSDGKALALEWGYKPQTDNLTIAPMSDPRPEAKPRTNENVFSGHAVAFENQGW